MTRSFALLVILAGLSPVPAEGETVPTPIFAVDGPLETNEGHATLAWDLPGVPADPDAGWNFELQQSRDEEFADHHVRFTGPGRALFVSGLRDGRTYFRVRAVPPGSPPGPWSETRVVEVAYPRRGRVLLLLGVGCVVFVVTVGAIVLGWRRTVDSGAAE